MLNERRQWSHIFMKGQCDLFNQACTRSILGTVASCYYCILFYLGRWGGGKEGSSWNEGHSRYNWSEEKEGLCFSETRTSPRVANTLEERAGCGRIGQEQKAKGDVYRFIPGIRATPQCWYNRLQRFLFHFLCPLMPLRSSFTSLSFPLGLLIPTLSLLPF
jgi:hypothetical protein